MGIEKMKCAKCEAEGKECDGREPMFLHCKTCLKNGKVSSNLTVIYIPHPKLDGIVIVCNGCKQEVAHFGVVKTDKLFSA